jgi:hypothetical protein
MFSPFRLRITPYHDSTSEPGSCVCASQQNGRPTTSMGQKYALPHCKSKNRLSRRKLITKHTLLSNDAASRNTASRTTVSGICPSKPHADANRCRTEHQVQSPGQLAIRSAYAHGNSCGTRVSMASFRERFRLRQWDTRTGAEGTV